MSEEMNRMKMGRQRVKRLLRSHIMPEMTPDEVEDLDLAIRKNSLSRLARVAAVIGIALLVFGGYRIVQSMRQFDSVSVVWENGEVGSSGADYETFGTCIMKVTNDGISCISETGDILWNYGYTMQHPSVRIRGDYGAVADIQAQTALIFNKEGIQGSISTTYTILNLSISSHGVLALELDDTDVNYINFYKSSGEELDIRIKTKLSGDGFPMNLSLSPEGTGLAVSAVYLDKGSMQNQIAFYNFDVGKSDSNRMVGYFSQGETMFPEVAYLSESVVCAFGDNQICLYSLRNESKPELIQSVPFETEIRSVFYSENQVGVICAGSDGSDVLHVYNAQGSQVFERPLDFEYTKAEFSYGNVLIYGGMDCLILNSKGKVRYQGKMSSSIDKLVFSGTGAGLLLSGSSMMRLKFTN